MGLLLFWVVILLTWTLYPERMAFAFPALPSTLPILPCVLPGLLQLRCPPWRQAVAVIPKWSLKARANAADEANPLSKAISVTGANGFPAKHPAARSSRCRLM